MHGSPAPGRRGSSPWVATQALRAHARQLGLEVPEDWIFEDEGHSGATLLRPALERLRDLAAQGCVDVVLCYSPDRLARKFAYQALLVDEFAGQGCGWSSWTGRRGDAPMTSCCCSSGACSPSTSAMPSSA